MLAARRVKQYPRVKILGGLYYARREPRCDPLLQEIKNAAKGLAQPRQDSTDSMSLVESQPWKGKGKSHDRQANHRTCC